MLFSQSKQAESFDMPGGVGGERLNVAMAFGWTASNSPEPLGGKRGVRVRVLDDIFISGAGVSFGLLLRVKSEQSHK